MLFSKEDLINHEYNWEEVSASVFSGGPSRRTFDRYNGNQVLFLINFYGSMSEKFSLEEARKMEDLILHHLPLEAKSEVSVFNWLKGIMQ